MMELQAVERGQVRIKWMGDVYECGARVARQNATKLAEHAGFPGKGLVKVKLVWFAGIGRQYALEWRGSKEEAALFAARLNIAAEEAGLQAMKLQQLRAEDEARKKAEQLARYGVTPVSPAGDQS